MPIRNTKRTDPHRPGAIIPADYVYLISFYYGGTIGCPPYNVDRVLQLEQQHGRARLSRERNGCDVCGARFQEGALFQHTPTGHVLRIGHNCADKYEMLADHAEFDAALEAHKRANAAQIQAHVNKQLREAFLLKHIGLADALACGHHITNDLSDKLTRYHSLSPAQIALAFKLAAEAYCPARPTEVNVPAPEGRTRVRGRVISCKSYDGFHGVVLKMTVKVATDTGVWLCWGTVPSTVLSENGPLKGRDVEFTATLKRGRDAHFALFKRPTAARVLVQTEAAS